MRRVALVVLARERLRGLQLRARLRVVDHHGPEVFRGRVRRDAEPVVLAAVEVVTVFVESGVGVFRADSDPLRRHRRRVDGDEVEEQRAGVLIPAADAAVFQPLIVVTQKGGRPGAVRVVVRVFRARPECDRARRRISALNGARGGPGQALYCEKGA